MAQLKTHKFVSALPPELEADAIYFVRAGSGFDLYVTNHSGTTVAYPANSGVDLSNYAPKNDPAFTGTPTAPTAAAGTNTTQLATTAFTTTALNLKANLASPAFTGTPTAPTQTAGNNTTRIATTAFVFAGLALKSNLASPTFTGVPAAPTASAGTSTTQIATTAFVTTGLNLKADLASPSFTGTPTAPTASNGNSTTQIATTAFVQSNVGSKGLSAFFSGKPVANQVVGGGVSPYAITLSPVNSSAKALTTATSLTIFKIMKNGSQVGMITFNAGASIGVVDFTSASMVVGDFITVQAPATADATISSIAILLVQ